MFIEIRPNTTKAEKACREIIRGMEFLKKVKKLPLIGGALSYVKAAQSIEVLEEEDPYLASFSCLPEKKAKVLEMLTTLMRKARIHSREYEVAVRE